jgi:toxin ParE1/3/4
LRVRWLRRALVDLDEAEAYIALDNPSAASGIVEKIVRAVTLLKDNPGIGRAGRVPGTKELVVPDTPYIVPYRVKDDTIQVLRVYHASRKWPNRL